MKCPLFAHENYDKEDFPMLLHEDCLKEECAWWLKASESCAMEAIPRVIGYVGSTLKELGEKMPHEGQFRK